jgi:hypothetical protein
VKIFEPGTDRMVQRLPSPGAIAGLAVAPNGRWVVGGSQDATLHGWKVTDGSDFRMSGFPTTVSPLSFQDIGHWMACVSGEVVTCWEFDAEPADPHLVIDATEDLQRPALAPPAPVTCAVQPHPGGTVRVRDEALRGERWRVQVAAGDTQQPLIFASEDEDR